MEQFDYRESLRELFTFRQKENPSYSGRAFARDLGISVTALHGVLNQTRHLAKTNLDLIAEKLGWSIEQQNLAFDSTKLSTDPTKMLLSDDEFQMIADWVHLAILNLAKIKNLHLSSLSARLGLDEEICIDAVERLKRLNYIKTDKDGYLIRVSQSFGVTQANPSRAIQSFHHSNLLKAQDALKNIPVQDRNFLTIVAPSNSEKLPELKKLIEEFRKQALSIFESDKADQVYFLNLQLYPVSKSSQALEDYF